MTNTFSYALYCDAWSWFHKIVTICFGHGYIRFGDGSQPSPKILFLVVSGEEYILYLHYVGLMYQTTMHGKPIWKEYIPPMCMMTIHCLISSEDKVVDAHMDVKGLRGRYDLQRRCHR